MIKKKGKKNTIKEESEGNFSNWAKMIVGNIITAVITSLLTMALNYATISPSIFRMENSLAGMQTELTEMKEDLTGIKEDLANIKEDLGEEQ